MRAGGMWGDGGSVGRREGESGLSIYGKQRIGKVGVGILRASLGSGSRQSVPNNRSVYVTVNYTPRLDSNAWLQTLQAFPASAGLG